MQPVSNHPNRSKASPSLAANPSPEAIRRARESLPSRTSPGQPMSQTEAAAVIYSSMRAWQEWESGGRRMHPAMWELWRIKTGYEEP